MSILSPVFKKCTRTGYKLGSFWHSHPLEWNDRLNEPQVTTKWKKLMLWRLNVIITIFYVSFLAVRTLQVNLSEDSEFSPTVKIYVRFIFFLYSFTLVSQYNFIARNEELVLLQKQTFTLVDQLSAQLNQEDEDGGCRMPKIFDFCLPFLWYMCFVVCASIGILNLVMPNSPDFISSVILPEAGSGSGILRWILLVLCALFQFNFIFVYAVNGVLYLSLFFGFVFPEFIALRQIKRWLLAGHTRSQTGNGHQNQNHPIPRRRIQKMLKIYRQLAILQEFFHDFACAQLFPVFKYLMMIWTVLGIYGFIRMSGFVSALLGVLSCDIVILLVVMVACCAEIHEKSKTILQLLKSYDVQKRLTPYEKKTCESFRLIKIQMRSSYFIDKLHVLVVIQIVINNTISILMTEA